MKEKQRAEMVRMLACDLCDRVIARATIGHGTAGCQYGKGEGMGKTQIHADIVQLRRMLALLDREVMG